MARSGLTTERLWEERLRRFDLGGCSVAAFAAVKAFHVRPSIFGVRGWTTVTSPRR